MEEIKKYIKPKIGDKLICVQQEEDEDFGMSGIVFRGNKDIIVGDEYEVISVDLKNVPKNNNKTWTKEEYPTVQWYWTMCDIRNMKGKLIHPRMCLGNIFRPK